MLNNGEQIVRCVVSSKDTTSAPPCHDLFAIVKIINRYYCGHRRLTNRDDVYRILKIKSEEIV